MKTLRELRVEVLRYFDVADEPLGSADVELVHAALNTANQRRATEDNWAFMMSEPYQLKIVAGQSTYILPYTNIQTINYLYSTTLKRFVEVLPIRQAPYEDTFEQRNDPTRECEILAGGSVVMQQPSSFDRLLVTSTAVEDGGTRLYVEGEDIDGHAVEEVLTPGAPSVNEYTKVTYYAKEGEWEGQLTLATLGGDILVRLAAEEEGKEYTVVRFYAPPTQTETISYRYTRKPREMRREGDRPDLPFPLSNVLIYDALLDLATYNELDSETISIWRAKQEEWELNLYALKLDANQVYGAPQMINPGRR